MLKPRYLLRLLPFLPPLALLGVLGLFPAHARPAADEKGKPAAVAETATRTATALYDGIRHERLSNGLNVYLKPIPGAPVVTTMVAYKVGSADEELSHTGLSHY